MTTAGLRRVFTALCALALVSCSDSSPTTPPGGSGSISPSQASGFAGGVGAATTTALESGGFQAGVASVEPPRRERNVAQGTAAGQVFGSATCPLGGREDLVVIRTFTPTNNDVDLTALQARFVGCKVSVGGSTSQMDGALAMSGHYFGASTGKTSDIRVAGTLTTPLGNCAFDGAIGANGNYSGLACGSTISQSTPPATTPVSVSGTWAGTLNGNSGTTPLTSAIVAPFTQSGLNLTATVTNIPGLKGAVAVFTLTQTAVSGTTLVFSGSEFVRDGGSCSPATLLGGMTIDTATNTMTGTFTGRYTDCQAAATLTYALQKQ